jgi:hypothetical protein
MPALGGGIYVFCTMEFKGVDGREKPRHDAECVELIQSR